MSMKLCCCLCCTPSNEYKSLQNNCGECNEIYEITIKYFDPMLLTEHVSTLAFKETRVLCLNCWLHIKDFDEFHQTVLKTRSSLEESNVLKSPLHIKLEEDQVSVVLKQGNEALSEFKDVGVKNYSEDDGIPTESGCEMFHDENECDRKTVEDKTKENDKAVQDVQREILHKLVFKNTAKSSRKRCRSEVDRKSTKLDFDGAVDDYEIVQKKRKKVKDTETHQKRDLGIHPALEKFRKHNEFIAEWKSELECDICSETFSDFDLLKVHFKDKHNARCYVKCCDRTFYRRCSLVEHIRLHVNPEMHKCDICGKLSASKYNLKLHKRTVHEGTRPKFECNVCQKIFKQKPNLERHLLTHVTGSKDFKCNECDRAYILEVQLKAHIKLVHNDNRVCDQCGKTLNSIGALKHHLKEHSGIEKPKYPCDECGLVLATPTNLKRHKEAYHNDGSTVYVCSICGKISGSERGLMNHRKFVHEKERKHKCPHCEKAFKRPKDLQEHIATHTGEALYQCQNCPQTFKKNSKFHEHRKKAHPLEWEKGRKNRLEKQKIDFEQVTNQVIV